MLIRKIWGKSGENPAGEKILIDRDETETIAAGYVCVESGNSTQTGFHDDEEEVYVILKGKAELLLGDETREVEAGDVVYVPRNTRHRMTCISQDRLEYLYFANWPR